MAKVYHTTEHLAIPMKLDHRHKCEDVSALLKGELCTILKKKDAWSRIKTQYDNYEGYVLTSQLLKAAENQIADALELNPVTVSRDRMKELIDCYIKTPYVRAGRTVSGIDCSGLVQAIGKSFGYKIERDSSLQAKQGKEVKFFEDALYGDFAFFGRFDENQKPIINHVGMILDNNEILHASEGNGCVAIDSISDAGIIGKDNEKTHDLITIRRILNVAV